MARALVIRTAGTNCERETCRAFELAGATPDLVHLSRLLAEPDRIDAYPLISLPGGFSYGDDIASGRILAMHLRERLLDRLEAAVQRGALLIGICNGFQVLVQLGLLPGLRDEHSPSQTVSLTHNASGRFVDAWTRIEVDPASPCVWTRHLADMDDPHALMLPSAHAEGRLIAESEEELDGLEIELLAPIRYAEDLNGSTRRVAGICDSTGHVFGLMPHPERFLDWTRHPYWTRLSSAARAGPTPGLQIFLNAVAAARESETASLA